MGYLGATWTQVFTCTRGADVSFRDVKIKIADRGMWMMSCTGASAEDLGGFEKSQLSWVLPRGKTVDSRLLAEALRRVRTCWGGRWKSQNRMNMPLSPYVEKPLNSKVIKSFVPELRSRKCFSCFGIPMFYVYMLRTFYVRFTYPYHGYGTWTCAVFIDCINFFFWMWLGCLDVEKIFSRVPLHQAPILTLVYPWYTNP